jgi:hypothetical protein
MKTRSDGVPEPLAIEERSKRTTIELCGDRAEGLRCTLTMGHLGPHECVATRLGPTRWESERPDVQ